MKLKNEYYVLRHGEAVSNIKSMNSSWPEQFYNPITKMGESQVKKSLKKLKKIHIDFMFSSDLLRTKQTASMAAALLKIKPKFDTRLREMDFGSLNNTSNGMTLEQLFDSPMAKKNHQLRNMETYRNILKRVTSFLEEVEKKYKGKSILIVSHQAPLWILENKINGLTLEEGLKLVPKHKRINKGELRKLNPVK